MLLSAASVGTGGESRLHRVPTLILFEDCEEAGRIDDGVVGGDRPVEFVAAEATDRASRS